MEQDTKKRNTPAKGFTFVAQLCALVGFACFFTYLALSQVASVQAVEAQIITVEAEIAREKAVQAELLLESDYIGSDAFFEKMARERLNMIRKDEIVFVIKR